MKSVSFLIKPASSLCNMRCQYCFYADVASLREVKSFGVMTESIMQTLIHRAFENLDERGIASFSFQGGEPTMAGLDYFKAFVKQVEEVKKPSQRINYAIQTNGYVINDEWAEFFHEYHFLVGVSLDGYKENHDFYRFDANHKGTFQRVSKSIQTLEQHQVEYNILTVLTNQLAKHPSKLYSFYRKQDFKFIQLIPCLDGFEKHDSFALQPEYYASFFDAFYQEWLKDYQNHIFRSINLFDNIIPMFANQPPYQCGMLGACAPQLVVEADGSVYPCDFYVLDQYNCGNLQDKSIDEILNCEIMKQFLNEKKEIYPICKDCPYWRICHGGCKRQRICFAKENYCGYRIFLDKNIASMQKIAQNIR